MNRRNFLSLTAAAGASFARAASAGGVVIGVQGYSFRDRGLDEAIAAARQLDLRCFEVFEGHLEPRKLARQELREWRAKAGEEQYRAIRRKFDDAGIELWSCGYNFREDFTDEEIVHGFTMARALGVTRINASANISVVERVDRFAQKAGIYVGLHNHSNLKANELATPENFAEAMRGRSKYIAIHLDIGHFTATGGDVVEFLTKNHSQILTLHLKDRKKNQGPNVPFGDGDTPIREVLQLLKRERWNIPALIEYEYKGGDTIEEVRRARDYCLRALA
jgi:sugar phosphate isomerase/epimerase